MKTNYLTLVLFLAYLPNVSAAVSKNGYPRKHSAMSAEKISRPNQNDSAVDLVDEMRWRSISEMDDAGVKHSKLKKDVWSDYYWATYEGQIANRYADSSYNTSMNWLKNERYLQDHLGEGTVSEMSPAEKYDLLVGDRDFTLTRSMIGFGRGIFMENQNIESWNGLCHGWAAAAMMESRPSHGVWMLSADGRTRIYFYPSDIKALTTLLWANGNYESKFIGGRCDQKGAPVGDRAHSGSEDCKDTNPGTWHLALVNQIGHAGRPFIFDGQYDSEVWNYPITSYSYKYRDIYSGEPVSKFSRAVILLKDYRNDSRRSFRTPGTKKLIRIAMEVGFIRENLPKPSREDSSSYDNHGYRVYDYQLELNNDNEILGGEWITENHPDFLWIPSKNTQAISQGDENLNARGDVSRWDGIQAIPASWQQAALYSARNMQPLARIVHRLIERANQQ